jgi:hypothetical protein
MDVIVHKHLQPSSGSALSYSGDPTPIYDGPRESVTEACRATLFLMWRIKHEERVLLHQFGAEYRTYMESTKRLIPFVY